MKSSRVTLRSPAEIAQAREAGRLAARVLHMITPHVQPGVSTEALDRLCHDYIVNELQVIPANVGYLGYPKTVCTSVNHVICHGIPSPGQVLKAGDIINIDVAIIKDGWFGDTSRMYFVGEPSPLARRLVDTTYEAMCAGIAQVRPGATLGDVGHAIQTVAHRERFSVVREYCGHGIGQIYHDEPQVLHYGQRGQGLRLEEGMVFTIEPGLYFKDEDLAIPEEYRGLGVRIEDDILVTADGAENLSVALPRKPDEVEAWMAKLRG